MADKDANETLTCFCSVTFLRAEHTCVNNLVGLYVPVVVFLMHKQSLSKLYGINLLST